MYGIAFTVVVCIGNSIMYAICALVSDSMGFLWRDDREACYMLLYLIACFFNVLVDLVMTYFVSVRIMEGLNFRTYQGTELTELPAFADVFKSYATQRSLAESLFSYAWSLTYLIPFLIEPVATIIAPLQIMKQILRSHPEIRGKDAEAFLVAMDMDMGRYADLLLNVLLGILVFYYPDKFNYKCETGYSTGASRWKEKDFTASCEADCTFLGVEDCHNVKCPQLEDQPNAFFDQTIKLFFR